MADFNYAYALILNSFPGREGFLWGRSVMINLATVAPGYQPLFDDYLKHFFNLTYSGGGLNPSIVGELYMTAGYPAIVLGMTMLGCLFGWIYKRQLVLPNPQNVMAYGFAVTIGGLSLAGGSVDLIFLLVYGVVLRFVYALGGAVEHPSRLEVALLTLTLIAAGAETLHPHAWILPWMTT